MTSDFMPLSMNSYQTASTYSSSKSDKEEGSSSPTIDQVQEWGYTVKDPNDAFDLDFSDFMMLMVQQLQNQTIDNTADTSDMLNQMVQMSVVQMMAKVQSSMDELTASTNMSYAASLVGKTVTVGVYNEEGKIEEVVGEVEGTGVYQGSMVIFIDGEMYPLNSIMAVGTLPEIPDEGGEGGDGSEGGDGGEGGDSGETPETPEV